jgi:LDH2 family malate/lactate/ureidoglycolate dehydrogenase
VPVDSERRLILDVLLALGADPEKAVVQADWLLEGDLRGHPSHGLHRLSVIATRIQGGLTDPCAEPLLAWSGQSALMVDGLRGLGPYVGVRTVEALIERSRSTGVAVGAVHNANHLGLLAPYVERCAEQGLIGIALTTSEALVHPWGGRIAQIGTNPIAVAVPAEPEPFVFDMATGLVSMGKILDHGHRGAPLEPGWALDADGEPTLDPHAAAKGAIAPFGGAKGYGLGLAIELLVAAVTGSALGREIKGTLDTTSVCTKGDLFICLAPEVFGSRDSLGAVSGYLDALRASPPQAGFEAVRVPGDRARYERARRLTEGVPVADPVWASLSALREQLAEGIVT